MSFFSPFVLVLPVRARTLNKNEVCGQARFKWGGSCKMCKIPLSHQVRSLSRTQISYWRLREQAIWVRDKWEVSLGPRPRQECVLVEPVMRWSLSTSRAGQGSCRNSLQSAVNFSGPKALNQIFKSNSKINIEVEWLWNPLDSFVICFC